MPSDSRLDRVDRNRRGAGAPKPTDVVGLCSRCRFARTTRGRGDARFWRCARSDSDPGYPRYPRLPVTGCSGWRAGAPCHAGSG